MATVAEFIAVRVQIESVVKQVALIIKGRKVFDSPQRLELAGELLQTLTTMADNDVQHSCVGRLTKELANLRTTVEGLKGGKARKSPGA